ncbi:hypothetical protein D3H65_28265 [Paraflavitalea soli]|uniref:Uncharacterized protein n=1 Tax=Paraflavitalea soli TaxID=2315862 RepID=A0A3B7MWQ0_9BACT|nr:hypothetical protein [Paraflavitalea soli]AXY77639.1 hypothetical protein D3H65_28265 [Paraflavitalea soli]
MKSHRPILFIYAKDVSLFTRKSDRHGANVLDKIRTHYGKKRHQPVTIAEFCDYMDLDEVEVHNILKNK